MATFQTSPKYSLDLKDLGKGFIVAALSTAIPIIISSLNAGSFAINWTAVGTTALASGLGYLVKNFFTPSQTVIK